MAENLYRLCKALKIYVVTGDEIGKGSDNEPLLKNVKIIEKLPFDYFRYGDNKKYEIKKERRCCQID